MGKLEEIVSMATKYGFPVIEDAAQSFGATLNGNIRYFVAQGGSPYTWYT